MKSYDQLRQHIKKQRHYFANEGPSSQSYGFSSSHVGCDSWAIKKAEHWRLDTFELWCWRRLLRVPWPARRSNQSILKEISPEYSWKDWCWSWNSNTLVTWCKGLTHLKRPWCWERLRAGGEGETEDEMVGWYHRHNGYGFGWTPGVGDGQGGLVCGSSWDHKELDKTGRLNWTELNICSN